MRKYIANHSMVLIHFLCVMIPLIFLTAYIKYGANQIVLKQYMKDEIASLTFILDQMKEEENEFSKILAFRNHETMVFEDGKVIASNKDTRDVSEIIELFESLDGKAESRTFNYQGKESIFTAVKEDPSSDRILVSIQPYQDLKDHMKEQNRTEFPIIFICILISMSVITIFTMYYRSRLNAFKIHMHKVADGDFNSIKKVNQYDVIGELYDDLNKLIESIQHLVATVYEEQVQKEKLNSRQKDVEFKMLASQINPHFLYNTLETIRMKARFNGQKEIEELVKMLAKIMRRNIQVGDNLVTLKSELELVEYYLKIQQYRFGERINFYIDLKCDIEDLKIMPLIIQPLVENAFVHGLETKEGKGEIRILVERNDRLRIHIIDNGVGMSKDKLKEIKESLDDSSRLDRNNIGLCNVNQRIKLLYGNEYGIYIDSQEDQGTTVVIELPEDMRQ